MTHRPYSCARCHRPARWHITAAGRDGSVDGHACDPCQPLETRAAARYGTPRVEELANAPPAEVRDQQLDLFTHKGRHTTT